MRDLLTTYRAGFLIAVFSGFFVATFFMLIELQKYLTKSSVTDIRDMWGWGMIVLRCMVGMGGAAILYFFFQAGVITGGIWRSLQLMDTVLIHDGAFNGRNIPNRQLSLLVVWCFLAGYSQTLVPTLLIKTEEKSLGHQ